jgi:hypothetical protein
MAASAIAVGPIAHNKRARTRFARNSEPRNGVQITVSIMRQSINPAARDGAIKRRNGDQSVNSGNP